MGKLMDFQKAYNKNYKYMIQIYQNYMKNFIFFI